MLGRRRRGVPRSNLSVFVDNRRRDGVPAVSEEACESVGARKEQMDLLVSATCGGEHYAYSLANVTGDADCVTRAED
jgi:hypothetical protein